ncbi:MAG: serine/threonine-protein kinase [Gemmataceae bacterium]
MAHPEADPWIGQEFGPYRIVKRLGAGGMGLVFLAEDRLLGRSVAVKILPREKLGEHSRDDFFLREARSLARLNHPNIVTVFAADVARGIPILVLEWMEGGSVQDRLQREGSLPWRDATRIIREACLGVAVAHGKQLIHRDLKPSNLLLTSDGTVKVGDFGLAKILELSTSQLSMKGQPIGTPHFMSPEQCRAESLDARSDIYSLGATYYTLLVGTPPFSSDQAMAILFAHCSNPVPDPSSKVKIPDLVRSIVMRAMAKQPSERHGSAVEMLRDLDEALAVPPEEGEVFIRGPRVEPMPAPQTYGGSTVGLSRPSAPKPNRRRWLAWTAASVGGLAIVGGGGWIASRMIPGGRGSVTISIPPHGLMIPMPGRCVGPAFSGDGRFAAVGILDRPNDAGDELGIHLVDLKTGEVTAKRWSNLHCGSVAFQPGTSNLVAGVDHLQGLRFWSVGSDLESSFDVFSPQSGGSIRAIAVSADRQWLAAAIAPWGNARSLRVWDLRTREPIELAGEMPGGSGASAAFSPDGRWLATTANDGVGRLWDMRQRRADRTYDLRGGEISPVIAWVSNDLIAMTHRETVEFHSISESRRLAVLDLTRRLPNWMTVSSDGTRLAESNSDFVRLWDIRDVKQPREVHRWNEMDIWGLRFSDDGRLLGGASHRRQLWVWRTR